MGLPTAIQKQAEEADRIYRETYEKPVETQPETETPPQEETPQSEPTSEASEQAASETPAEETKEEKPETEPETEEPEEDYAKLQENYNKLVKSHELLKNKYDLGKNVEEYKSALDARDKKIEDLESRLDDIFEQLQNPDTSKADTEKKLQAIREKLKADVGDDTANAILDYIDLTSASSASTIAQQYVQPYGDQINSVRQDLDSAISDADVYNWHRYVNNLTEKVPDWQTIMVDPNFASYLNQVDLGSGKLRHELAQQRQDDRDADGMAYWYNAYKDEIGLSKKTKSPTIPAKNPPKKDKEALIAPASTPKSATVEPQKPIYTSADLKTMEKDIIALKRSGLHEKANAIEKTLNDAIADNRIRF